MAIFPKSKTVAIAGLIGAISGAVTIISWIFHLPGLETFFPQYVSMRFNTGLCFLLLSLALLSTQSSKNYRTFFIVISAIAVLFAALSLSQNIFGYNLGIDQLFVRDYLGIQEQYRWPGRMAANVSASFLILGMAFIGFTVKNKAVNNVAQYMVHAVTIIATIVIMGYLYGISLFYNFSFVASMAISSAILFLLVSVAASVLQPALGIAGLFTGVLVGNQMARRLFVLFVLMGLIMGELRLLAARQNLFSVRVGIPLFVICFLIISLLIIWFTANWLNGVDQQRYEAEEEIKVMNEELEERVQERTAELFELIDKYRESESIFRAAFEHSGIGMAMVSFDGRWLKVNKRICDLLGYSEQELLSKTFMDITYPDDLGVGLATFGQLKAGETDYARIEKRYVRKDGDLIWASVNLSAVMDEYNKPAYIIKQIEDITDRKKLDARFRTIVESVFVGIKLNDAEGNIIYRSPSMQAINGWTDEEMNRKYFKLAHPDDLELIKKKHAEVLASPGKSISITYRILHRDGHYIWIESLLCNKLADPELAAIITVTRDVTERMLVEDQLKKSERKYHSLIEQASDAIYLHDYAGYITEANEAMYEMSGYSREELLQMRFEELLDPEQVKAEPIVYKTGFPDQPTITERRYLRKDGRTFDAEINVKVIAENQVLVIARDISQRKRMESELRDAELKFRMLAEKSMVGVYISQNERFIYANPRFAEIFGYELQEVLNTKQSAIDLIIYDDDREVVRSNVRARYGGETENAHYEVRGKKKDGTVIYIEFFGNRVVIEGKPSIIGTTLDITERRMAQELVMHEKRLSETIIESLPQVFYLRNRNGDFLRWNKNFEKVSGYNAEEVKHLNAGQMLAPEDREEARMAVEQVSQGGQVTNETRVIIKDGTAVPFLITISALKYEGQDCIVGTAVDITAQKRAEEELRSSEHKYKLLFESNPLPMWMMAKDDFSVIAANEAVSTLYGYTHEELLRMKAKDFRLPEDQEAQAGDWQKQATDPGDERIVRHVKKDGSIMFVQIIAHDIIFEGRPVRLSFTNDVTEKIKAEETLKKSEANFKTIMDTTDTVYVLLDGKLRVMAYNQMAVKFVNNQFRKTPSQADRLEDYFPADIYKEFRIHSERVLDGRNISYEINYPQPDGEIAWYYVRLFPIKNAQDEILGMMVALSDISERKNAEESLKTAYKLVQDHIDSIKDMAWKQSHLIRSPLANLKGLLTLLELDHANPEVQRYIKSELDRLDEIIIEMAEDAANHD